MDSLKEYEELEKYEKAMVDLAINRTNFVFGNGHPAHARILFATIFRCADRTVRLFSGQLSLTQEDLSKKQSVAVFGSAEVIAGVKYFLSKPGSILKVLMEKDIDQGGENPFVRAIQQPGYPSHVEIRRISPEVSDWNGHFCVMDKRGIRYELDHDQTKAVANFNDQKNAQRLIASFDRVFDKSEKYLFRVSSSCVITYDIE